MPSPVYSGATTAAALTPFIAGQVTNFVFANVDIAASFSQNLIDPFLQGGSGPISSTQEGPEGGQVTLNGYVSGTASGWVNENFNDYSFQPQGTSSFVTLNGQLLVEVNGTFVTYGYTNYEAKSSGFDMVLSGTAAQTMQTSNSTGSGTTTTASVTLNLGIADRTAGIDQELTNFTLVSQSGPNVVVGANTPVINRTFNGRVYNSAVGYLDMQTKGAEVYLQDPTKLLPIYGADVLVSGNSNTTPLQIGPLNYYFFSVEISTQNNGIFDASARYNWNGFTADTTPALVGSGPVAIAEESSTPAVNTPISLDGRFSHSPGGDYLKMQWSLLYATPGSHPMLADADLPQATLTVDKAGDYLVLLTVNDGNQSSQDTLTIRVPATNTPTDTYPMAQSVAGPDVTGQIGVPVLLDGRASFDALDDGNEPTYDWNLIAPPASKATLSNPTSAQPSFTPDVPGYYHVQLNFPFLNTFGTPSAQSLTVTVDEPIAFRPPVNFDGSSSTGYFDAQFQVADVNGDGKPDVLFFPVSGNLSAVNPVNLYLNTGNGTFASPVLLSAPGNAGNGLFATIADLSGDGRLDIIVSGVNAAGQSALFVFLQNSDGSFAAPATYTYGGSNSFPSPVAVGHLFGSSTLSVAVLTTYGQLFDFAVSSNGTLQPPTVIALPQSAWGNGNALTLVDFNNNGLADIISNDYDHSDVYLLTATSTGNFSAFGVQAFNQGETACTIDLYGDGKNELVIAGQSALQVYSEAGTSPASYPMLVAAPSAVGVGDVNGDGLSDIVVTNSTNLGNGNTQYGLGFFLQQTYHSFAPEVFRPLDAPANGPVWVGDLNGDGIADLMYMSAGQPVIQFGYKP
ncbi:MAG: FG-GAP-like repeat-containing protein [Gammaproteobacteria bacterium]